MGRPVWEDTSGFSQKQTYATSFRLTHEWFSILDYQGMNSDLDYQCMNSDVYFTHVVY